MISRDDFDAYNRAVEAIAAEAEEAVAGSVLEWCRGHPDATVAECRDYAIRSMEGMVQAYDEAAATLAARWYDGVAEDGGTNLRPAVTSVTYSGKLVADTAKYQARKLAAGDVEGFAASCGELARNDALKSVNQTVIANCGRDRREGVRFARVPTGFETCTFCLMLASRGAVYYTRESAGEFSHYHRRCDCKVVPGFADDPMAELVDGASPAEFKRQWLAVREIESRSGLSPFERRLLKNKAVGKKGSVAAEPCASPLPKERRVMEWLSAYGLDICFRETRSSEGKRTSDLLLDGVPWEIKQPVGNGKQTIYHQFEEASGQSPRLILDLSELSRGGRWNWETVEAAARKYLRWHFKDADGETVEFESCLLIDEEKIKHIKKGS